jgi:hypothetical protein
MVNTNAMTDALGDDGVITFETEWEKGTIRVVGGRSYVSTALKKTISAEAVMKALKEMNDGK